MATDKQIAANRANSQKSTGPTSAAGVQASSQNRRTHGLCGDFLVLSFEDQERFNTLLERFVAIEQPADDIERELVLKMARHTWQSNRASQMQESVIAPEPRTQEQEKTGHAPIAVNVQGLETYLRYQTHHDRSYQRAAAELAKRQKTRQLEKIGFESQKRAEEKHEQQKAQCAAREMRAQAEEKRREQRQQKRDDLHPMRVCIAQAEFELKSYKVFDRNPNFTPPGVMTSAA